MSFTDHDTLTAEPVDSLVHARNMYAATEGEWRDAVRSIRWLQFRCASQTRDVTFPSARSANADAVSVWSCFRLLYTVAGP